MNFSWSLFIHLGLISAALLLVTLLRAKWSLLQRILLPNALLAGFLLLPLYNFVLPRVGITSGLLGDLTYHLLSLSFIAIALKPRPPAETSSQRRIMAMSIVALSQYGMMSLVGLGLTVLMIATFMPGLYEPFGYLLPLGYILGPGQAFAIGEGWSSFGIEGAASVGLTFAALGYVVSAAGGLFLVHYGMRRKWIGPEFRDILQRYGQRTGVRPAGETHPVGARLTTDSEAVDSLSFNVGLVLLCYVLTYLCLQGLTAVLELFGGDAGHALAVNLWGVSFIFALFMGLLLKHLMQRFGVAYLLDNGTLTRISGFSVDFMVTSAVAAISLVLVSSFWLPILILGVAGALVAGLVIPWLASRLFEDHVFERALLIFGLSTGTLSTGLALLRIVDPDFETPVASDHAYAAGIIFLCAIPLLVSVNLPVRAYATGDSLYIWWSLGICLAYVLAVGVAAAAIARKPLLANPARLWAADASVPEAHS